ncbi:MAG: flagellar basal body rod protein FlgB [Syntrophothermus sp.]
MPRPIEKSIERLLDYCNQKQKVLSKNIANIGTEGYKREDIKFKEVLNENFPPLRTSNEKHIQFSNEVTNSDRFETIIDQNDNKVSGINNVDIDTEMAEMAENNLKFRFASRKMGDYYRNLQNVIKGGSGR